MPFALCDSCVACYIVDREESARNRCSRCDQPLRTITREESLRYRPWRPGPEEGEPPAPERERNEPSTAERGPVYTVDAAVI
jgi:hypothetical protein